MNLTASQLAFSYSSEREILSSVSLTLDQSQVLFILGSNGSGKTTLLECMSGLRTPLRGNVTVNGRDLHQLSARARAQSIGLVPQMHEPVFAFTVEQAVLMGRAVHLGLFGHPGKADYRVVQQAIAAVGIEPVCHRPYTKISGGERQLTLIARGLAQGAQCLFMDEPVAHLDPHHQHQVLSVVRQLADEGFSFIVSSHLPNHALLYGDWVAFLTDGQAQVQGPPTTTITEQTLSRAYAMDFEIVEGASGSRAVLPRIQRSSSSASSKHLHL